MIIGILTTKKYIYGYSLVFTSFTSCLQRFFAGRNRHGIKPCIKRDFLNFLPVTRAERMEGSSSLAEFSAL